MSLVNLEYDLKNVCDHFYHLQLCVPRTCSSLGLVAPSSDSALCLLCLRQWRSGVFYFPRSTAQDSAGLEPAASYHHLVQTVIFIWCTLNIKNLVACHTDCLHSCGPEEGVDLGQQGTFFSVDSLERSSVKTFSGVHSPYRQDRGPLAPCGHEDSRVVLVMEAAVEEGRVAVGRSGFFLCPLLHTQVGFAHSRTTASMWTSCLYLDAHGYLMKQKVRFLRIGGKCDSGIKIHFPWFRHS